MFRGFTKDAPLTLKRRVENEKPGLSSGGGSEGL